MTTAAFTKLSPDVWEHPATGAHIVCHKRLWFVLSADGDIVGSAHSSVELTKTRYLATVTEDAA